jgi:hypothetical protein
VSKSPVTTITDELLAEIEVEAGMATGGKWEAVDSPVGEIYIEGECNEFITGAIDHVHDANFIALASPGTVLAIITELRTLRAENEARQAPMVFVRDAADILRTLIENIDSKGNYSPEATALFLNQVLGCIHAAMQEQPQ